MSAVVAQRFSDASPQVLPVLSAHFLAPRERESSGNDLHGISRAIVAVGYAICKRAKRQTRLNTRLYLEASGCV